MQKLFETIDQLADRYVTFWTEICNIESPTHDKAGVDAVGQYAADAARALGWKAETYTQAAAGNVVCITLNPDAPGAPLTLSAHMDTVHPHGLFGDPPVRIEGDKIYGPGVIDCKGGVAVAFLAMEALDRCGYQDRPVQLLLQSDEECGSSLSGRATIDYICERAKGSAAFINLEPSTPGQICVQRKGIANFLFEITGVEAHSSQCAVRGANAIAEAAYKILEMEKLKDHEGLTCSVGTIQGGSVPNTVAGSCRFCANVRFTTREQYEQSVAYAHQVAETVHIPGCTCRVTETSMRICMERTERNLALMERMNDLFEAAGLPRLEPVFNYGGSDAAEITAAGIPCVDSLGVSGGLLHSADEYADINSLREAAKRVVTLACGL